MMAAELFGQKNGILIIVGVRHIGFHGYIPFCVGDVGRAKSQWSEGSSTWRAIVQSLTHHVSIYPSHSHFWELICLSSTCNLSPASH
jgi:hypothetical protein